LPRRGLAVVSLHLAHEILVEVEPPAGFGFVVVEISSQVAGVFFKDRHGYVTRENVVERRDIRGALNRSMAAQRENPAAWTADIAEEQLQDGCRANDLHAVGMLRPANGVTDGRGFIGTGSGTKRFRKLEKDILRHTAGAF